jgi:hypothetical protein
MHHLGIVLVNRGRRRRQSTGHQRRVHHAINQPGRGQIRLVRHGHCRALARLLLGFPCTVALRSGGGLALSEQPLVDGLLFAHVEFHSLAPLISRHRRPAPGHITRDMNRTGTRISYTQRPGRTGRLLNFLAHARDLAALAPANLAWKPVEPLPWMPAEHSTDHGRIAQTPFNRHHRRITRCCGATTPPDTRDSAPVRFRDQEGNADKRRQGPGLRFYTCMLQCRDAREIGIALSRKSQNACSQILFSTES